MTPGKSLLPHALTVLTLLAAPLWVGCSSSDSNNSVNTITAASQDLTVDPDGETTVLTFQSNLPAGITAANFATDGAQMALAVVVVNNTATVTWDDRVSPSDQIQVVGVAGVSNKLTAVTSTDTAAPTFTAAGTQVVGATLGMDTITVTFAGANVVEADAEDPANWRLDVAGEQLDLTGAVLTLNTTTQVLTFDLPSTANLHSAFTLTALDVRSVSDVALATTGIAGAATGDVTAPTLVGGTAVQNLAESEFGFVVDLQFSEPMSPVFSVSPADFTTTFPNLAQAVSQPSDDTLRVTFTEPMVPGSDMVSIAGIVDAHGNAFAGGTVAVSAGSTVVNAFATSPTLSTVANEGGDNLVVEFVQAIDPADADDPTHWSLVVDAVTVDLTTQSLSYDLASKELTIDLTDDFDNGDAFTFEPAGGNQPLDVDGQSFTTSFSGAVSGETAPPTVTAVTQNRSVDPTGQTVDVAFSEDVDTASAQMTGNYSVTGGLSVTAAVLQTNLSVVRLTLDGVAVPGDVTVDVSGIDDLASNTIVAATMLAVASTDAIAPSASSASASAVEGANNDTLIVNFDDNMVASEVTTAANWTVEYPVGTAIDESLTTISYDPSNRVATMTFGATSPVDLKRDEDFSVSLATMRDIGGNAIGTSSISGTIDAESNLPVLESAFIDSVSGNMLHVRFNEACDYLDDLFDAITNPTGLTSYEVRDSMGTLRGTPSSVSVHADERGATLTFGFVVAGTDTLDIDGVADLADNPLFPVVDEALLAEEAGTPAFDAGMSGFTVLSGEENDTIELVFDRPMSRNGILDSTHYDIELAAVDVDLGRSLFTFDGDRTVTIELDTPGADNLQTAGSYDVTIGGLTSAQGIAIAGTTSGSITAAGGSDSTAPTLPANSVRLDPDALTTRVLVQMDEAIDEADAVNTALIDLMGVSPTALELVGPRTVRATFPSASVGQTLNVSFDDLAGNTSAASLAVVAAETTSPLLVGAVATSTSGFGGDELLVTFDEPVSSATALDLDNYALSQMGASLDLTNAVVQLRSGTNAVRIRLPNSVDFDTALPFSLVVSDIEDPSGNVITPAGNVAGAITGDLTAPSILDSFVNLRASAAGNVIDVLLSEDVDATFAGNAVNWSIDGGQTVNTAEILRGDVVRLTLDAVVVDGDMIEVTGLLDAGQNASGTLASTPRL